MANNTKNYNLLKPVVNEVADIEILNENMDIIDEQMKPINSLASKNSTKALAAEQGRILDEKITKLDSYLNTEVSERKNTIWNPNLLVNGGFEIWQRGDDFTGYNIYTADMWFAILGTKTVSKGNFRNGISSLKLVKNSNPNGDACIMQQLENYNQLQNEVVTMSFFARSIGGATQFAYNAGADFVVTDLYAAWTKYELNCIFTYVESCLWHRGVAFFTRGGDGDGVEIAQVKLELGNQTTKFVPQNYGVELSKCQRYLVHTRNAWFRATSIEKNIIDFTISVPTTMRALPTLIDNGAYITTLDAVEHGGFTFAIIYQSDLVVNIRATKINHGLADAVLDIRSCMFSAEL